MTRPVVAIVCDRITLFGHDAHAAFHGYVHAVAQVAGALPLLLPASGPDLDVESLLAAVDGLLLTGSPSNVEPTCYAGPAPDPSMHLDRDRDAAVLQPLPRLVAAGLPLFGVCRGLQELNVAYGGTLHTAVHEQPGLRDHRIGDLQRPLDQWYADKHPVRVQPGGVLAQLLPRPSFDINSLHEQGIDRLGQGLRIEAQADDGLVEAISVAAAPQFTLAVQWHPEMRVADSAEARTLFAAFGDACRARHAQRLAGART